MKREPREYEDDDGRTVADMSEVHHRNLFIPRSNPHQESPERENEKNESTSNHNPPLNRKETRSFIMGALSAGLLIALVFIIGLGLAIAIMLLIWNR